MKQAAAGGGVSDGTCNVEMKKRKWQEGLRRLDLSYSLLEGLWYSDKETADGCCWVGGLCGEGEERVERSGEGASFGERDW